MKLTILGSGSPEAHKRRASSGYLIDVAGQRILFDCGGGVFDRLLQAGLKPSDIDVLVFSHLHSDHMMDYARLVHAAWDEGGAPLRVYGPAPIATITDKLFGRDGVFSYDLRARTELVPSQEVWIARGGTLPRPWPNPEVEEIKPGFVLEENGWRLEACEVPHAMPELLCLGFSLQFGTQKFVYSGDTGPCQDLEDLAQDADLLLHWCFRLDGEHVHPALDAMTPTPRDIAAMAHRVSAKKLVITHFRAHMDSETQHADALAMMAKHFDGPAEIAEDLKTYEV